MKTETLSIDLLTIDGNTQARVIAKTDPLVLFTEYTFLEQDTRDAVVRRCMECDTIPLIDWYQPMERFVFHSLCVGESIYKKACSGLFKGQTNAQLEREYELSISALLGRCGIWHGCQIPCDAGIADIVTERAVIELKANPTRDTWQKAIGQVLAYQVCFCGLEAVICTNVNAPKWVAKTCYAVGIQLFNVSDMGDFQTHILKTERT